MSTTATSKPGKHGTLHLFEIAYRDGDSPTFTQRAWRYNEEHARDAFAESIDADGWEIVRVSRVKEGR